MISTCCCKDDLVKTCRHFCKKNEQREHTLADNKTLYKDIISGSSKGLAHEKTDPWQWRNTPRVYDVTKAVFLIQSMKKKIFFQEAPGWLSWFSVWVLISAQLRISALWVQAPLGLYLKKKYSRFLWVTKVCRKLKGSVRKNLQKIPYRPKNIIKT